MTPTPLILAALAAITLLLSPADFARAQNKSTDLVIPATQAVDRLPHVVLQTNFGKIVLELYPDKAPLTVENFLSYVRSGHYDGIIFHRVINNLLIQGGDFTANLEQKPELAAITNEASNGLSNQRGTIAAARRASAKDSATSQFFINTVDNPQLDFVSNASPYTAGHCVFGRVIEGMEVVDKIRKVPTTVRAPFPGNVPATPVVIEHAGVVEG